ncbi:transcription factor IIIC subunit delta N-term-domain-containing protein [Clohesyomyces aquaticus]|uniref:Transcription factor IIIC subunit delta N-term-domain-containing protein n=1 Tax=Clohesyomyces aquaticus TaxID=1231657 RepID=A0A1Y1Y9S8_9PLEO|nr:transcription factor IIIC subunit delta N-term-domain-containing protein [Clohesyomyces aquaticus]
MSDVTEIRCWPSGPFAIDWSADGIIAIASAETVELLFPNIDGTDNFDTEFVQWRHIPIQVSWFTRDELPVKLPQPLRVFSVGEEISSSVPLSISWSPPGLAKHRRCALAVFTSNLILSIWGTVGKPQEVSGWARQLIINDALDEYFSNLSRNDGDVAGLQVEDKACQRRRIRTYCWAPGMNGVISTGCVGTQLSWGKHMIAVSNDDNDLVLVELQSPTSSFGNEDTWKAEVLGHFSLLCSPQGSVEHPGILDEYLSEQQHICHVSWSPWAVDGEGLRSVLSYATNTDLRARVISYSQGRISVGPDVVWPGIELRYSGPLKWLPNIGVGNTLTLAVFTMTELLCLTVSAKDACVLQRLTHNMDGRWDTVSGVAFDIRSPPSTTIHFSSVMGTTHYPTAAIEVLPDRLSPASEPYWQSQLQESQAYFSANFDLAGTANPKTWGLSASPLGDFVASCFTMHPTDMIEYHTVSERRGTIAVSHLSSSSSELIIPTGDVSTEGVLFTIKKWWENNIEDDDEAEEAKAKILEKLLESHSIPRSLISSSGSLVPNPGFSELDAAFLSQFKQRLFLDPNTLKDRYKILISMVCHSPNSSDETSKNDVAIARTMIGYRISKELQRLQGVLSESSVFSTQVLANIQEVSQLIRTMGSDEVPFQPFPPTIEACEFCGATLKMEDLSEAQCPNGHQFVRCGLTFLAIQGPGISKYCGVCSRAYFSDEYVLEQESFSQVSTPAQEQQEAEEMRLEGFQDMARPIVIAEEGQQEIDNAHDRAVAEQAIGQLTLMPVSSPVANVTMDGEESKVEPPMTLTKLLFWACDVCIYCGGKFVG